jgi:hypothetical protein
LKTSITRIEFEFELELELELERRKKKRKERINSEEKEGRKVTNKQIINKQASNKADFNLFYYSSYFWTKIKRRVNQSIHTHKKTNYIYYKRKIERIPKIPNIRF